jgi:hypothetical protein
LIRYKLLSERLWELRGESIEEESRIQNSEFRIKNEKVIYPTPHSQLPTPFFKTLKP